jgi:hypothetical protein
MAFTLNERKDLAQPPRPVLLADFTFPDGAVWRAATVACNWGGHSYAAALADMSLDRIAALSEQGIDRVQSVTLNIADPAGTIYATYERGALKGFRGTTVLLRLALLDLVANEFSTDSLVPFIGICDQPTVDEKGLTVAAQNKLNLAALQLPIVPISPRCPWINPSTTQQRTEAADANSRFFLCGETRDLVTAPPCAYTRQSCTQPLRFGGSTWQAAKEGEGREYISGDKIAWANPDTSGKYRQFWPQWLGGAAWVEVPVLNQWADGNYTRGEAAVGSGAVDVLRVIVNNIELTQGTSGDYRWHYVNDGDRDGAHNTDTGYADGDPYGNLTVIQFLAPHSVIDPQGAASIRVLGQTKSSSASIAVASAIASDGLIRINFTGNAPADGPGDGALVTISGNSWGAANITGIARYLDSPAIDHIYIEGTYANGSGTGGTLYYKSNVIGSGGSVPTTTALRETLKASGRFADPDLGTSWNGATTLCSENFERLDGNGDSVPQRRFTSAVALRDRRPVSEIVRGLRCSIGARLYFGADGKLEVSVEGPLAEQQPAAVDGSNYNTPITSTLRDGSTANGYAAYRFDESNCKNLKRTTAGGNSTTPNKVVFPFSDPSADWAVSSFGAIDSEDVSRMDAETAGGLQVQPEGIASYNHSYRIAVLGLAKVLRGNPAGDTRGTEAYQWESSFRACKVQVGHIVLLDDLRLGLTDQLVRITGIKPDRNYESVTFTGHYHSDIWYADTPPSFADPERKFFHFVPPPPDGSSRTITASGDQLDSDNLVLCDTSGITGSTTTLSAAVTDTTGTAWSVTSGAAIVDGTYIQVGTETVKVMGGGGTSSLTVLRGALGTVAATVNIGGALAFQLLEIAVWPEQELIVRKTTSDLNYVKILAGGSDTFPGGSTQIILPSDQAGEGTVSLRSPAATETVWIQLAGAGAAGPAGPAGSSGAGVPAPNVTATCAVSFQPWAHAQEVVFSGVITLPTGHADYSHLKTVEVYGVDPGGDAHFVGRFDSWAGSTISYGGVVGLQPAANETWKARFIAFNEQGSPTDPPYELTGIGVPTAAVTSITSPREVPGSIEVDKATRLVSFLYGGVPVFANAQVPQVVTYWLSEDNGANFRWIGWQNVATVGTEIAFRKLKPATAQTWKLAMKSGAVPGEYTVLIGAGALPSGTVVSAGISVAALAVPASGQVSSISVTAGAGGNFPYNRVTEDGVQYFSIPTISFVEPSGDANTFVWRLTATDLNAAGTAISTEQPAMSWLVGTAGQTQSWGPLDGAYGTTGYRYTRSGAIAKVRLKLYACNRIDQTENSFSNSAAATLQTSLDVTVAVGGAIPAGEIPADRLDPTTLGDGLYFGPDGKPKAGASANPVALQNPGFEDCPPGFMTTIPGWKNNGGAYFTEGTPGGYYSGTRSVRITNAPNVGMWQEGFMARPGDVLYMEAWAQAYSVTAGSFIAAIHWVNAAGAVIGQDFTVLPYASASSFAPLRVTSTAPAGVASAKIIVACSGDAAGGWWYVDNVLLHRQPSTGQGLEPDGQGGSRVPTGGISESLLAALAVSAAKIQDGAIQTAKIQDLSVITSKLATGAVNSTKLADLAVEAAKLADSSVTATKIANAAVGTAAIANLAVGNGHIQNGAITNAKIGNLAVGTAQIQDAAITTAKINNLAVTSALIADGAILTAKIGDAQITSAKIDTLQVSKVIGWSGALINIGSGVLFWDGSTTFRASVIPSGFLLQDGSATTSLVLGALRMNGTQVVTYRQTGPGNASGWADATAQAWANNLLTALRAHGLIT